MTLYRIFVLFIYILAFGNRTKVNLVNPKHGRGVKSKCHRADLPEGVKVHGSCSFLPHKTCKASCRFGGTTFWRRDIKCTSSGQWSIGHKCSPRDHSAHFEVIPCGKLIDQLPGEKHCVKITQPGKGPPKIDVCPELLRIYVQLGKCSRVGKGECAVSCLEDAFSLLCMAKGVWYPHCRLTETHKNICPAELPPSTLLHCPRTPGSECKLRCPDGKVETALCSTTGQWTRLPKCHFRAKCASQPLSNKYQFLDDKCKKSGNLVCNVKCANGTGGEVVATCSERGVWVRLPDCPARCPAVGKLKDKDAVLISCPGTVDSNCKYKCMKGLIPKSSMKCDSDGHWKGCICCKQPRRCPQLDKKEFETQTSCSRQLKSTCRVSCKSGQKKWVDVRCVGTGVWSGLPVCKRCPVPVVPNASATSLKSCSGKTPGEKCKIACRKGYSLQGYAFIECTDQLVWTDRPTCVKQCPSPMLAENNLRTSGSCTEKLPEDTCVIKCTQGGRIIGENTIKCLQNSSWSRMPGCFCPKPSLPEDLAVKEDDCSIKRPKEICPLRCSDSAAKLTGNDYITCNADTKWSRLPTCGTSYCSPPILNTGVLRSKENCSRKAVHQTCLLECVKGGNFVGKNHITCLGDQKWSLSPDCTCPMPKLREHIQFKSNCTTFARNETCNVKCKSGYKTGDKTTINCLPDLSWSSQPTCSKLCPKPKLSEKNLQSAGSCAEEAAGSTCSLSCVEGGELIGNNMITCLQTGEWTALPDCCCPAPSLTGDIITKGDCTALRKNEKCELVCKNTTSRLTGNRFIVCNSDTRWSQLPTCSSTLCPPPSFTNGVVRSKEDCSKKAIHKTCSLECSKGGNLTGSDHIKCLENQTWSRLPDCTCPPPNLEENVELAVPCVNATKTMLCTLKCKFGYEITGGTHIKCMDDLSWYDPAKVTCKMRCPEPKLAENHLLSTSSCSGKFVGDICEVRCATGGKFIGDTNFITCLIDGKWSSFPLCYCPTPNVPSEVSTTTNCDKIPPSEICKFHCEDSSLHLIGKNNVTCKPDLTWESYELRCVRVCSKPTFSDGVLTLRDDCIQTFAGGKCKVFCTNGGTLIDDSDSVKCLDAGVWANFPRCTCPSPNFNGTFLKSEEDCSTKRPIETCKLKCIDGYRTKIKKFNLIECKYNASWEEFPTCYQYCPEPIPISDYHNDPVASCKSLIPGETCLFRCKHNANLALSVCKEDGSWTYPPCRESCTDILTVPSGYFIPVACKEKKEGEYCSVNCGDGALVADNKYYVTCLEGGQWSGFPKCQCQWPKMENPSYVLKDCAWENRGQCRVVCWDAPDQMGLITCDETNQWSAPTLSCTPYKSIAVFQRCQILTQDIKYALRFQGDRPMYNEPECQTREDFGNEVCKLTCKYGYLKESPWAECKGGEWVNVNTCYCQDQYIKGGDSTCSSKRPGEACDVKCSVGWRRGGEAWREPIKCLEDARWNYMPGCTMCSEYKGNDPLTSVTCKPQGEIGEFMCDVKCSGGAALGGEEFTSSCIPGKTYTDISSMYSGGSSKTYDIPASWSPPLKCVQKCGNPVLSPHYGIEFNPSLKVGSFADVWCVDPSLYHLKGSLQCKETLTWEFRTRIECDLTRPKECGHPVLDPMYKIESNYGLKVGSLANVTCADHFFRMTPRGVLKCQETLTWEYIPGFGIECDRSSRCGLLNLGGTDSFSDDKDRPGVCRRQVCVIRCRSNTAQATHVRCDNQTSQWVWDTQIDCFRKRSNSAQFQQLVTQIHNSEANFPQSARQLKMSEAHFQQAAPQFQRQAPLLKLPTSQFQPAKIWGRTEIVLEKRSKPVQFQKILAHFPHTASQFQRSSAQLQQAASQFQRPDSQFQRSASHFQPVKTWMRTSVFPKRSVLCRDQGGHCNEVVLCPPIYNAPEGIDFVMAFVLFPMQDCSAVPSGGTCIVRCRNGQSVHGGGMDVKVPLGGGVLAGKMTCGQDGVWSAPYFCRCPKPEHRGISGVTADNCKDSFPHSSCPVECAEGFYRRLSAIWCNDFGFWKRDQEPCVSEEDRFENILYRR